MQACQLTGDRPSEVLFCFFLDLILQVIIDRGKNFLGQVIVDPQFISSSLNSQSRYYTAGGPQRFTASDLTVSKFNYLIFSHSTICDGTLLFFLIKCKPCSTRCAQSI